MLPGPRTRRRAVAIAAVAAVMTLAGPSVASPAPQVVDPADDAYGGAYWGHLDTPTPVDSQRYTDVVSVLFRTMKATKTIRGRRTTVVTGFTVTLRTSEPPIAPADTVAVYRVLADGAGCVFGIDYYTRAPGTQPQSAVQEWRGTSIRRIALARPVVSGATITWTVPLSAVPKNAKVGVGPPVFPSPHPTERVLCVGDRGTPGAEQEPCAVLLDQTLTRPPPTRSGSYPPIRQGPLHCAGQASGNLHPCTGDSCGAFGAAARRRGVCRVQRTDRRVSALASDAEQPSCEYCRLAEVTDDRVSTAAVPSDRT
jgi:hypothetical protein